jgi:hypothetical protein
MSAEHYFHERIGMDMRKIALGSVLLSAFVMYPVVAGASTITFTTSGNTTGGGVVAGSAAFTTTTSSLTVLLSNTTNGSDGLNKIVEVLDDASFTPTKRGGADADRLDEPE